MRGVAFAFQQFPKEARGRPAIAPRLHEDVDDVAVLVHRPPEVLPLSLDGHEQLVQIPRVAHSPASAPQPPRVVEPERLTPLPNRLVGDGDAALGQQVFCIAKAKTETMIEPDGVADDFGRERYPW